MDFIEGLPRSEGYNAILVIVDRFTKYSHFIPLKHPFTAPMVAKAFLSQVVKLLGPPLTIVSDRDKNFTSSFWKELFKLWNIKLLMSTAYHPQTDGQTERVNQCLEMYLRCSTHQCPTNWHAWIPLADFWYNTSYHTSLGCSPYKALYGHEPNYGTFLAELSSENSDVQQWIAENNSRQEELKEQLSKAQTRIKHYADQKRSERSFSVGDKAYLKLQAYAQHSVANRPYPKLAMKFFGPFQILEKIGQAAYKLELPDNAMIHPVFHVSQLKEHVPDHTPVFSTLPSQVDMSAADLVPANFLDRRLVKKGSRAHLQVLIQWSTLSDLEATWEEYDTLRLRYPDAPAWGQAGSQGEEPVSTNMALTSWIAKTEEKD